MKILFTVFLLFIGTKVLAQTNNCIKSYTNLAIDGSDLKNTPGASSSCCQACQQTTGCKAYTWSNDNGGTCWLKSAAQPLYPIDGHFTGIMSRAPMDSYAWSQTYDATNFFDYNNWHFALWDLTNITKNVDWKTAEQLGMVGYQNGKVYMGLDHNNTYPDSGRPSMQISSNYLYNSGLFILKLDHMPTGMGTWPAFWLSGPNWPKQGEIDILEGIFNMTANLITVHTGDDCVQKVNNSAYFTGSWGYTTDKKKPYTSCTQDDTITIGCSVDAANNTFNTGYNQAGGGVFAMQWEQNSYIRIWNFVKPNIPDDIVQDNPYPNPDTWGLPTAHFTLGPNCTPDHFSNQTILFDIALCGGWVDGFYPGGEAACENDVKNHPELYTEAYWLVDSLKIYCRPTEPCGFRTPICEFGC